MGEKAVWITLLWGVPMQSGGPIADTLFGL
jgi:hypothetical protein